MENTKGKIIKLLQTNACDYASEVVAYTDQELKLALEELNKKTGTKSKIKAIKQELKLRTEPAKKMSFINCAEEAKFCTEWRQACMRLKGC